MLLEAGDLLLQQEPGAERVQVEGRQEVERVVRPQPAEDVPHLVGLAVRPVHQRLLPGAAAVGGDLDDFLDLPGQGRLQLGRQAPLPFRHLLGRGRVEHHVKWLIEKTVWNVDMHRRHDSRD